MKKQEKKLLISLGNIDDKYLDQAKPRKRENKIPQILTVAASLVLVVGISLWVLLSGMLGQGDSPVIPDGSNSPIIPDSSGGGASAVPDNLYSEFWAGEDYSRLVAILDDLGKNGSDYRLQFNNEFDVDNDLGSAPEDGGVEEGDSNGSYINATENQVEGVEEPDIFKMTDKYIFRIGNLADAGEALRIYTIDGDNSIQVAEFPIPYFNGTKYGVGAEMFISEDGTTVTLIKGEFGQREQNYVCTTTLMLIDTSDITSPKLKKYVTVNGMVDFARCVDGKIILGTDFVSLLSRYDWSNSEEYLPYYDDGKAKKYFAPKDIICPDEIYQRTYSSFFIFDDELNVTSGKAVFGITGTTYVSENKIITSVGYSNEINDAIESGSLNCRTDFAVIDYSSGSLKVQSIITADGWIDDRFFMDESDGYLRVVTNDYCIVDRFSISSNSSSLYVFKLENSSLAASIKDFSPKGECATAVRFEGDRLYVCTAEIQKFTDPVFFFDLSDLGNITQVNTGFIDGFSSVLITYGDGYLLGIGSLDRETNKVSLYKREGDMVETVSEYFFRGAHSDDRKAFIIDKENGLFGFQSCAYYDENRNYIVGSYHLLKISDNELTEIFTVNDVKHSISSLRAVYYEGYLYIILNMDIIVKKVY